MFEYMRVFASVYVHLGVCVHVCGEGCMGIMSVVLYQCRQCAAYFCLGTCLLIFFIKKGHLLSCC